MKRHLLDIALDLPGFVGLHWRRKPPGVYCFNFHRVGNDDGSEFHPNMFSCTNARFGEIVRFLCSSFEMIGLDRLIEIVERDEVPSRPYGMITFDDGYAENFHEPFQVLQEERCPAVYFITTNFVDGSEQPWWDLIAWRVFHMRDGALRVPGSKQPVPVSSSDIEGSIRRVLRVVKDASQISMAEKVAAIEAQVSCPDIREANSRLFLSWDEVREMRRAGMWFGSHTRRHSILSHLSEAEQREEMQESKRILESQLGGPVGAIAYPVGGFQSYNATTLKLVRECGYQLGFVFEPGVNRRPAMQRYELRRMSIDQNISVEKLRRSVASVVLMSANGSALLT